MIRRHLTYANVMASIAVFIALAGGAYAAVKLPRNSVGPAQLRKDAVTSRAIKANAVKGADVDEGSLAKVSSAKAADRATTADSATTAGSAQKAANADHATAADSAISAASATSAASAGKAADADTLDGKDSTAFGLRCPAGTLPKWGACLELTAHSPVTPLEAIEDCSARGGRLPSWLELTWVRQQSSIEWAQGAGAGMYEMTGEVLDPAAAGGGDLIGISQGGAVFNVAQNATNVRYRCVLSRVNG
jgi:hypothetical protein